VLQGWEPEFADDEAKHRAQILEAAEADATSKPAALRLNAINSTASGSSSTTRIVAMTLALNTAHRCAQPQPGDKEATKWWRGN
jgi:hypothetical protein